MLSIIVYMVDKTIKLNQKMEVWLLKYKPPPENLFNTIVSIKTGIV